MSSIIFPVGTSAPTAEKKNKNKNKEARTARTIALL